MFKNSPLSLWWFWWKVWKVFGICETSGNVESGDWSHVKVCQIQRQLGWWWCGRWEVIFRWNHIWRGTKTSPLFKHSYFSFMNKQECQQVNFEIPTNLTCFIFRIVLKKDSSWISVLPALRTGVASSDDFGDAGLADWKAIIGDYLVIILRW